jgi:hypothetical protein
MTCFQLSALPIAAMFADFREAISNKKVVGAKRSIVTS